ncbi:MAG: transglutaminase protein [Frankiales bacterium]|nr:transglutaminase protein [Frankiales bacterium]
MARSTVRYRLRQSFAYAYDAPALSLLHRLVVVPPRRHGDQLLRLGAVRVDDDGAQVHWERDGHGNAVCTVRAAVVPERIRMDVDVVVERTGTEPVQDDELLRDPRLHEESALTVAGPALRRLAHEVRGGDAVEVADRLCAAVHAKVGYTPGATTVRTTAVQALALGAGVCQDQAHVFLAAGRAAGLACRYVSGHLVGQGGTHAWVEVVAPAPGGARVIALDPCHARRTDDRYVTVAVGRDYLDVPPTSGWYGGPARGTLTGSRVLERVA